MNNIQKPNDILIATLSAPQANVVDLLQNNITAENTSFLTPEEYKQTPFVKQRYTQNGIFNEAAFNYDYLQAYQKFSELAEAESMNALSDYIEHAPQSRFASPGSKKWDVSAEYKRIHNPLQRQYGVQGIYTVSDPTLTPEESAQSNHIYDPKTNKFLDETPEDLNIFKKAFGQTLVYAKWESDGVHVNPQTGQSEFHRKGDWKTDKNGNYYTEFLGDRELLDKQVVSLSDIITDEGTLANRLDFFDSDGYDKSTFGIIAKTTASILPYLIPGLREYYAGFTVIAGLAAALPTFYKSFESILGLGSELQSSSVTTLENWFRKYDSSKSYKGRESFWTLESMGELVADVWAQAYQQRAAASAAKWFSKKPKLLKENATMQEIAQYEKLLNEYYKGHNRVQSALSLGYMSLISTADMYNETLRAGYDKDVAGWAALASAAGMFGIMNFNETARGIGTWMLDKTTGFQKEAERGVIHKLIREKMDDIAKGVKEMKGGNKQPLADTWIDIRKATRKKLHDVFVVGGEAVWKNMFVEGVEEVTEEIIQDSVKGIIDAMASTGMINQEGSFGGWSNVFSRQGLERYLATFFGGAIGGGLFSVQHKLDQKFYNSPIGKDVKYTLRQAILEGRTAELFAELERHKRFYNTRQGVEVGEVNGHKIYLGGDQTKSQADIIYERALGELRHEVLTIARLTEGLTYDPKYSFVHAALSENYDKSGLRENYIEKQWENQVQKVAKLSDEIRSLNEQKINLEKEKKPTSEIDEQLKKKEQEFEEANNELKNWLNGERFAEFTLGSLIYLNKKLSKYLLNLSIEDYAKDIFGVDYNTLSNDPKLKKEIDEEFNAYTKIDLKNGDLVDALPRIIKVLKKTMPIAAKTISDYVGNSNNKIWLKMAKQAAEGEAGDYHYETLLKYLGENSKFWSLSDKINFDLAKVLESEKIIDLEGRADKEIIEQLINHLAIHSGVNVWNEKNIEILLSKVNTILRDRPNDNEFSIRLNEIDAEQQSKEKDDKSNNSQVDVQLRELPMPNWKNKTNIQIGTLQNIKLKTIIDLVSEDDAYIDEELYHLLETALNHELSQRFSDLIKEEVNKSVTDGGLSLQEVLQKNLFKSVDIFPGENNPNARVISFGYDFDFSGLTEDNILSYIVPLKNLLKILIEQNERIEQFKQERNEDALVGEYTVLLKGENDEVIDTITPHTDLLTITTVIGEDGKEYIQSDTIASILSRLIRTIENGVIMPSELEQKWNVIKEKSRKENPLYSLIKDLSHKFGVKNDYLINWFWNRESEIHAGNYILSDQELEDIDRLSQTITFATALLACMQQEGSELTGEIQMEQFPDLDRIPLPFNGVLRNYYNLYGNSEMAKMFPIFSREELADATLTLQSMMEKVQTLRNINAEKINDDNQADVQSRKQYIQNTIKELNTRVLKIGESKREFTLCNPEIKDENPENPELYIGKQLQQFRIRAKKAIADREFTLNEFIDALIETYPEAFIASESVIKGAGLDGNSDKLNFDTLIDAFAIDYYDLYSKLADGLQEKSLLPRFDQETAIKSMIAKCSNDNADFYAAVNQRLFNHFQKYAELKANERDENGILVSNPKYDIYKQPLNYTTSITGPGGSGKTTIMQILIDSLKPENILLLAPTEEKVSDLKTNLKTNATVKSSLVTELLSNFSDLISAYKTAVENQLVEKLKTTTAEFSIGEKKYAFTITANNANQVIGITFTDNTLESLRELIADDFASQYANSLIILDENSNIDQLSLVLLDTLAQKSKSHLITLGDNVQIGTTFVSKNGVENVFNIHKSMFVHKVPELSGILRAKNSGIQKSLKLLREQALVYTDTEISVDYNQSHDSKEIRKAFKTTKLTYRNLMGVQILNPGQSSIDVLSKILEELQKGKSFAIIYDGSESSKTIIKSKLKQAGFTDEVINNEKIYKTIRSAQGSEADLVYIFGLTTDINYGEDSVNGDIDLKRMYTAISRGKEFVLVEDDPETKGLFSAWGVKSVVDDGIGAYDTNVSEAFKREMNTRYQDVLAIKEGLSSTSKSETPKEDVNEEEEENNDFCDPDAENIEPFDEDDDGNSDPASSNELPSDNPSDNVIFKNGVKIYGYYTRLGISKEDLVRLLSITDSSEDLDTLMADLHAKADSSDKRKDLLGFWVVQQGAYSSGRALINDFIRLKKQCLYEPEDNELHLNIKSKRIEDFSYLKPNNKEELDQIKTNQTLTTIMKRVVAKNGESIYITIGRVGYNYNSDEYSFSKTIKNLVDIYLSRKNKAKNSQHTYQLMWNDGSPETQELREQYRKRRQAKLDQWSKAPVYFIPQTGLKIYKIDKTIKANEELFSAETLKFGRSTIKALEALGYEIVDSNVKFKNEEEFRAAFNRYRFGEDVSDEVFETFSFLWKYRWIKIKPIGVKTANDFNTRLILAQQVKDSTIFDVIRSSKKTLMNPFHMKIVLRYLSNLWDVGQNKFDASSQLKSGKSVNSLLVNHWIKEVGDFIEELETNGKIEEAKIVKETILPYFQEWTKSKGKRFPKANSLDSRLVGLISDEKSKHWMFDYVENLDLGSENAITQRVPEDPNFFMNLDEFTVIDKDPRVDFWGENTTSSAQEVEDSGVVVTPEPESEILPEETVEPEVKKDSETTSKPSVPSTLGGGLMGVREVISTGKMPESSNPKVEEKPKSSSNPIAPKQKKQKKTYIFFDTETNGKPKNKEEYEKDQTHIDIWPDLLQLAWIITDENGVVKERKSYIIKRPSDYVFDKGAQETHHIDADRVANEGVDLEFVLQEFLSDVNESDMLIGHNADVFDRKVVACELFRLQNVFGNTHLEFMNRPIFDTMTKYEIGKYVGIRWSNGTFKWPSLSELYLKMTGEEFDQNKAHDALADADATMTSYFKLKEKGIIPLTSEEKQDFVLNFLDDAELNPEKVNRVFDAIEQGIISAKDVAAYVLSKSGTDTYNQFMQKYQKSPKAVIKKIFNEFKKCSK